MFFGQAAATGRLQNCAKRIRSIRHAASCSTGFVRPHHAPSRLLPKTAAQPCLQLGSLLQPQSGVLQTALRLIRIAPVLL
ncbi:hypothetical protein [Neisseria animalis]|uniref:hypothetical protein n=1 Tax=Neisseria animalis TaxID=492 RepID=UPI000F4E66DC|nr:hypothetical protein [Neisseria animalis]ROW31647.1 hypothetical protein CGZ60_09095 [Neisseria animalis]